MTITKEDALFEVYRRSPERWRNDLLISGKGGLVKWGTILAPFQKEDFAATDPALKFLAGVGEMPEIRRFFLQRGRGSSKTTDLASMVIWLLVFSNKMLDGVVCAEDKDQALLIRVQALKILANNPWMYKHIDVLKTEIRNKRTGSKLVALSRDTASSFGLTPDFVIADEFTHWQQQEFWGSVFSSFAKEADVGGMLVVACNAGYGTDWKWKVREMAKTSPLWYLSSPEGHAPWYTEETIAEQKMGLPTQEFQRLWMNKWQASGGEFVTLEEAEACVFPELKKREKTQVDGWTYVASVDYAEKHDRVALVVGHMEDEERIIIDRMDVLAPELSDGRILISTVEQWMESVQVRFGGKAGEVHFVIDPYQMLSTMQRFRERGYNINEFNFSAGTGNYELAKILRQMILHQRVRWYKGCGEIFDADGNVYQTYGERDDLCSELSELIIKATGKKWRFDHEPSGFDDRAFAVGALCHYLVINGNLEQEWNITQTSNGRFGL